MNPIDQCCLATAEDYHPLEDYQGRTPRWCVGCGDHTILTALLRLCRDEQLRPEKTVFVSGIGCSSRFPHYLKKYGFLPRPKPAAKLKYLPRYRSFHELKRIWIFVKIL